MGFSFPNFLEEKKFRKYEEAGTPICSALAEVHLNIDVERENEDFSF